MTRRRKQAHSKVTFRRRVLLTAWLTAGGIVVARASQIQVAQGATWKQQAEQQHRTSVQVAAPRGSVFDRSGVELALSREAFKVSVAPREIRDVEAVTRLLTETLGLDPKVVRDATTSPRPWRVLPKSYPPSVREALRDVRGLYLEREHRRFYPRGDLARGLLGLIRDGEAYGGVEQAFDESLRGTEGSAVLARDPLGQPIPGESVVVKQPEAGGHVVLTLDVDLQEIGRKALVEAVAETEAQGGDLVITDPRTGDILAMVSIQDGSTNALSAINTPYEPGSTLKPFTVAGLLENDLASLGDSVDTGTGHWTVEGRTVSDVHPEGGEMTLAHALEISSNVGVAKAAQVMSPAVQYQTLRDFGLGAPTGIELPGEGRGTLRRPERWSRQSQVSLAIGYEVSVTPLQMAMAYGALANGGRLMQPRLVKEVRDAQGRTVERFEPRMVRQVVSPAVTRSITEVLVNVVEDGTGTRARLGTFAVAGKSGTSRAWSDGGYQAGDYFASFVGFFPAEDPQLVVLVKLDRPSGAYYGGATAAPVTRATLQAILAAQQTPLDRNALVHVARAQALPGGSQTSPTAGLSELAATPVRFASLPTAEGSSPLGRLDREVGRFDRGAMREDAGITVPDVTGLSARAAVRRMHELGLRVRWEGSGPVTVTLPEAGSRLSPGDTVSLASRGRRGNG